MRNFVRLLVMALVASLLAFAPNSALAAAGDEATVLPAARSSVNTTGAALLDAVLGHLVHRTLTLTAGDWTALAAVELPADDVAAALQAQTGAATPVAAINRYVVLDKQVAAFQSVATDIGATAAATALSTLRTNVASLPGAFRLVDLVDLDADGLEATTLNGLDLVSSATQALNYWAYGTVQAPTTVSGAALGLQNDVNSVDISADVSSPPSYVRGGAGTAFASSAIRMRFDVDLVDQSFNTAALNAALNGLGTVSSSLTFTGYSLYVEVAAGAGTIEAIDALTHALALRGTPGVAKVYQGSITDDLFFDRNRAIVPATDLTPTTVGTLGIRVTVPIIGTTIADVTAGVQARSTYSDHAPAAQDLSFSSPYPDSQSTGSTAGHITTAVAALKANQQVAVDGSLGALLDPLKNGTIIPAIAPSYVNALATANATMLTSLVDPALRTTGIGLAQTSAVAGEPTAPVDPSPVVDKPSITGAPVVDGTLTVVPGAVTPAGATSWYSWIVDGAEAGTGPTYTPKAADVGLPVTVEQTATDGTLTGSATSDATAAVAKATFTSTGSVTIAGSATPDSTLTSTSTVATTPAATSTTRQWFRGTTAVDGRIGATYAVSNDDAGATITLVETRSRAGYTDLVSTSNDKGPVAGVIIVGKPVVVGTPTVDVPLTLAPTSVDPADAGVTYSWMARGVEVGTAASYTPEAGDVGATITAVATATKGSFSPAAATSDPTAAVLAASFVKVGTLTVSGTAAPNGTLTATSTVTTTPATTSTTVQWFRGAVAVDGQTGSTYAVTNADAGATITAVETRTRAGYADAVTTSNGVGPIEGVITLEKPVITGTSAVDSPLTVSPASVSPADATVTYSWLARGVEVGTGESYTPKPADVGAAITVVATATKVAFGDATATSDATAAVTTGVFDVAPTAGITGSLQVGEVLTAGTGSPSPAPDSYTFRWLADGVPIAGETGRTLTLTPDLEGAVISLEVTAVRAGYVPVTSTSAAAAPVASDRAPQVHLGANRGSLRVGGSTFLVWTSVDANSVRATGGWSGARGLAGVEMVSPTKPGTATYVLTATNANGTTTSQVSIAVTRPAVKLHVSAPSRARRGSSVRVKVAGLAPGETVRIRIAGVTVARSTASATGRVSVRAKIKKYTTVGRHSVTVIGSQADRAGSTRMTVRRQRTSR